MNTDKILNKINCPYEEINVNKNLDVIPDRGSYIREFNKGKSFEFSEWKPLTKYTNDCFKQDFVSYGNTLLACNKTHVSEEPPVLKYNGDVPIGVDSENWVFVFSASAVLHGEILLPIDEELLETSTNAIQNKAVYNEMGAIKRDINDIVNGKIFINMPTINTSDIDKIFNN